MLMSRMVICKQNGQFHYTSRQRVKKYQVSFTRRRLLYEGFTQHLLPCPPDDDGWQGPLFFANGVAASFEVGDAFVQTVGR